MGSAYAKVLGALFHLLLWGDYVCVEANHEWKFEQQLLPPASNQGVNVALDGSSMIVGSPKVDGGAGAFYYYRRTPADSEWRVYSSLLADEVADLCDIPRGSISDLGASVLLGDRFAYVGAPAVENEDVNPQVFVLGRPTDDDVRWQCDKVHGRASDHSQFGAQLALAPDDDTILAVGAPADKGTTVQNAVGAVYLYHRDGITGEWDNILSFRSPEDSLWTNFGSSISFRATSVEHFVLAVGAPRRKESSDEAFNGAVFLYKGDIFKSADFDLLARIDHPDGEPTDDFGSSVLLSSRYGLLVGAPDRQIVSSSGLSTGTVYAYENILEDELTSSTSLVASPPEATPPILSTYRFGEFIQETSTAVAITGSFEGINGDFSTSQGLLNFFPTLGKQSQVLGASEGSQFFVNGVCSMSVSGDSMAVSSCAGAVYIFGSDDAAEKGGLVFAYLAVVLVVAFGGGVLWGKRSRRKEAQAAADKPELEVQSNDADKEIV